MPQPPALSAWVCQRRTVFEVLLTRFPELPKQIVMDNVCNLHSYIMNREPEHFKDVQFYIDEAHFRGHKHCCPAYNTRKRPCCAMHILAVRVLSNP